MWITTKTNNKKTAKIMLHFVPTGAIIIADQTGITMLVFRRDDGGSLGGKGLATYVPQGIYVLSIGLLSGCSSKNRRISGARRANY